MSETGFFISSSSSFYGAEIFGLEMAKPYRFLLRSYPQMSFSISLIVILECGKGCAVTGWQKVLKKRVRAGYTSVNFT
jgi:hypothetical protein